MANAVAFSCPRQQGRNMAEYYPTFDYGVDAPGGDEATSVSGSASGSPVQAEVSGAARDPVAALEVRRRLEVMKAMTRLLTGEASSERELQELIADMSKEDINQVAEERGLSGRCGYPMCSNPCSYKGKPRYSLQNKGGKMDFLDLMCYCSPGCKAKVEFLAQQLGDPYNRLKDSGDLKAVAEILKKRPVSHGNLGDVSIPMKDIVQERDTSVPDGFADLMEQVLSNPSPSPNECKQPNPPATENSQESKHHATATHSRSRRKSFSHQKPGTLPVIRENSISMEGSEGARLDHNDSQVRPEVSMGNADPADPQAPVLYFDIEDAVGPLEGDVGQKFGRLTLVDPAAHDDENNVELSGGDEESPVPAVSEIIRERMDPDDQMSGEGFVQLDGALSESDDGSDEDSMTGGVPYLSMLPSNSKPHLSKFGRLYSVLDSMITADSIDWIHNSNFKSLGHIRPAEDRAAINVLSNFVRGGLSRAVEGLKLTASRKNIEKSIDLLVATFRCPRPVPSLSGEEWTLFVIVLLVACSWNRLPGLQDLILGSKTFESWLDQAELSMDLFQALLHVLAKERQI